MRRVVIIGFMLALMLPVVAQIRGNNITVTVQPNHQDWKYKVGEKATFVVSVLKSGTLTTYKWIIRPVLKCTRMCRKAR